MPPLKTYTAQTGFVYQYYFVGKREALADDPEAPAIEYIFDVTTDRKLLRRQRISAAGRRWRRGRRYAGARSASPSSMPP